MNYEFLQYPLHQISGSYFKNPPVIERKILSDLNPQAKPFKK